MKNVYLIPASPHRCDVARDNESAKYFSFKIGSAGVGTTTPDASSVFEIKSTTKGMLIPRLTKTQRDAINDASFGIDDLSNQQHAWILLFRWRCVETNGAAGVNKSLSNLTGPTAVNVDLVPASMGRRISASVSFEWKGRLPSAGSCMWRVLSI
jgi:hypothetical protein